MTTEQSQQVNSITIMYLKIFEEAQLDVLQIFISHQLQSDQFPEEIPCPGVLEGVEPKVHGHVGGVGLVDEVTRDGERSLEVVHLVRGALRYEEALSGIEDHLATADVGKF